MSDSLPPHGLHHAWLPCPSPTLKICSNLYPSSWWCYPTISSSVIPFSSCLQSFPASESFPVSWLFASSGQSIGAFASASVFQLNNQGWFPLGLTDLISSLSKGNLKILLYRHSSKASILQHSTFFIVQLSHPFMTTGKTITLTTWTSVDKIRSLLFNTLSRFVFALVSRSNISSLMAYWTPTDLRASSFTVMSFCLFILFMGFSRQKCWCGLPFPSPVGHILSELSTMIHLSWVALHIMTYGFIELGKVVIHDWSLHSVFPLMDKMLVQASWWEGLAVGKTGSCSGGQGYAQ